MYLWELIKAIIFGIVEGITEWLPISSTGHLILLDEFLKLDVAPKLSEDFAAAYWSFFEVAIQLGAILAVVVLFWHKIWPFSKKKTAQEKKSTWMLLFKVGVASIPAALVGIVFDKILEKLTSKDIEGWLYNWQTVAIALIVYGIAFILLEKFLAKRESKIENVEDITFSQAILVGCFQALSIIPGTSRSGSTILGSRAMGFSRTAAAEFSFLMGIVAMIGASLLKGADFASYVAESSVSVPALAIVALVLSAAVAFAVSIVSIRFLMDFIKKHSFIPFGIYRIALGAVVILYFALTR